MSGFARARSKVPHPTRLRQILIDLVAFARAWSWLHPAAFLKRAAAKAGRNSFSTASRSNPLDYLAY